MTPQEELFIDLLFEPGNTPEMAKIMAGYEKDYPIAKIVKAVSKDIISKCDDFLATHAPRGILGLLSVIDDPTEPGAKVKLQAISDLLDRAGVVKKDKTEIQQAAPQYLFILPNKTEIQ